MLVILRRGGSHLPSQWDMLQTTSSHGWAIGDETNSMRFATSLEEVRGLSAGHSARPRGTRPDGGVAVAGPSLGPGSPMGRSGESVGVHGQGRGPGRSVNAGAPHKARRVGELRESDEGSLLLLPFRCAAAQLGKASASG